MPAARSVRSGMLCGSGIANNRNYPGGACGFPPSSRSSAGIVKTADAEYNDGDGTKFPYSNTNSR